MEYTAVYTKLACSVGRPRQQTKHRDTTLPMEPQLLMRTSCCLPVAAICCNALHKYVDLQSSGFILMLQVLVVTRALSIFAALPWGALETLTTVA